MGISLDSKQKNLEIRLIPNGETEEVVLTVKRYELEKDGEEVKLFIREVFCSREWINNLAEEFLVDKSLAVPAFVEHIL